MVQARFFFPQKGVAAGTTESASNLKQNLIHFYEKIHIAVIRY